MGSSITLPAARAAPDDAGHGRRISVECARTGAFVIRCAGAATLALWAAVALGLPESVWAAMSALIVSQERLQDTRASLVGRIFGTLLGIGITGLVSIAASRVTASTSAQMAIAVALCAVIVREFPRLRAALWTCPVIFLTAQPSIPILTVAAYRGAEVILGAVIGWVCHRSTDLFVNVVMGSGARFEHHLGTTIPTPSRPVADVHAPPDIETGKTCHG